MKYDSFVELINCSDLAFVARAIGKTEGDKPHFEHMKIEEKDGRFIATATDGNRLHKAVIDKEKSGNVSPGYWKVLRNESVEERDYDAKDIGDILVHNRKEILWLERAKDPMLLQVEISEKQFTYVQGDLIREGDIITDESYPAWVNTFIKLWGNPIREGDIITDECYPAWVNTLIKKLPEPDWINFNYLWDLGPYEWHYKVFGVDKPILFENENKTALIMPIRMY
jgi:hypothetical protein